MIKQEIVLFGAGGHCRSCIDVIEQGDQFWVLGIIDRPYAAVAPYQLSTQPLGYPIIGTDEKLEIIRRTCPNALITIGQITSAKVRISVHQRLKELNFTLPVIVSPHAHVSPHATIGEGTIVMHHAIVNAGAIIGRSCILNTKSLIEHDAAVGDHSHVSTAAVLNGGAVVGCRSFIGSNATVVHDVRLADDLFCRAGKLVKSSDDGSPMTDD
mgnify:CR=1 FL=1